MKLKYIDIYVNGNYAARTVNYKSLKEAVYNVRYYGGIPVIGLTATDHDTIEARYAK